MNTETLQTRASVYDLHNRAFANVQAYVIAKDGARVATIAFKFPKDGAGRLWAYVHWIGTPRVRGSASGYGYDKRSAAVNAATRTMPVSLHNPDCRDGQYQDFIAALAADSGEYFADRLREAGFDVWQAV